MMWKKYFYFGFTEKITQPYYNKFKYTQREGTFTRKRIERVLKKYYSDGKLRNVYTLMVSATEKSVIFS